MSHLIVGLGNPGNEYEWTRHNVGFMLIDKMLDSFKQKDQQPLHYADSFIWTCRFAGKKIYLQKPLTFMNLSGKAVAKFCRKQGISPENVLIVYDDIALPIGRLRIRQKGSSGGHNGLQSVIDDLQTTNVKRFRIGIAAEDQQDSMSDFVLSPFEQAELEVLDGVLLNSVEAIKLFIKRDIIAAMNKFNSFGTEKSKTDKNESESNDLDKQDDN